jgi:hydroxypyruvate isomerase
MPKFAANLTMLFNEAEFLDRFALAAKAGFKGVEFLFPYAYSVDEIAKRLNDSGTKLVLHNLPAGNWAAGERGIACLPGREEEFRSGVDQAIQYATALGCPRVNCLAGIEPKDSDSSELYATFVENLRFAADLLAGSSINLLIEPINTRDIPGFFLHSTRQARAILLDVNSPNLKIQYDLYHMQIMEGDLAMTIQSNLDSIGHIQIADNPRRNEPGTGEINFGFLFGFLDTIGYAGWIGCEYKPRTTTVEGLGWFEKFKAH